MKRFTLLIILFIASTFGFAQNKLTDSLKYLVSLAKEDTTRVLTIAELGLQFRNSNPDSSIYYGQKALASNARPDDPFGRGKIQIIIKDNGNGIPDSVKDKNLSTLLRYQTDGAGNRVGFKFEL